MNDFLKDIKCFLLDMDGTIYLGDKLLPGAIEFITWLQARDIPFLFLTNNSSKSNHDYIKKLRDFRFDLDAKDILTSGQATIQYLKKNSLDRNVFVLGTDALQNEFVSNGITISETHPAVCVLGFDTSLTYQKLNVFCSLIRDDRPFIATHSDINCPTAEGFIPDIGATIEFIRAATERYPDVIIGKPNQPMANAITSITGIPMDATCVIGDRLYTDMAMKQHGCKTALVLCGETLIDQVHTSQYSPDLIINNIGEILSLMDK